MTFLGVKAAFKELGFVLKFLVAILCVIALTCIRVNDEFDEILGFGCVTYLFIAIVFMVVYVTDSTYHRLEMLLLGAGCIIHVLSGILFIYEFAAYLKEHENNKTNSRTRRFSYFVAGISYLTSGALMIWDLVREIKKEKSTLP